MSRKLTIKISYPDASDMAMKLTEAMGMSFFTDKYQKMIQEHPISELKAHMDEFSICDLKFQTDESKFRAQIFDNGKFVFSITPKQRKRKSTKND